METNIEEMRKELEAEKQRRANECMQKIGDLLAQYHCKLDAVFIVRASKTDVQIQVMAED